MTFTKHALITFSQMNWGYYSRHTGNEKQNKVEKRRITLVIFFFYIGKVKRGLRNDGRSGSRPLARCMWQHRITKKKVVL